MSALSSRETSFSTARLEKSTLGQPNQCQFINRPTKIVKSSFIFSSCTTFITSAAKVNCTICHIIAVNQFTPIKKIAKSYKLQTGMISAYTAV